MTTIHEEVNPFIKKLKVLTRTLIFRNRFTKGKDGLVPVEQLLEKEGYTKLFNSSDRRKLLATLKPRSSQMLLWIMMELEPGQDYIWINRSRYMEEHGIETENTYRAAVKNLLEHGLLKETTSKDWFWINPHYFFRGDRIRKYILTNETKA